MDIETLKNDLVANQKKFEGMVTTRNNLNLELVRLEAVIVYIRELIKDEERIALAKEKEEKEEVKKPA